ncbi:hypothetical protein SDC9_93476 [bioreactor metagenome]|uniref:Uncharacterized protein n=1 Tax=bioreactor metagenome TaxID=1076179 RepID=A0A645A0Q4_9ZZZZ
MRKIQQNCADAGGVSARKDTERFIPAHSEAKLVGAGKRVDKLAAAVAAVAHDQYLFEHTAPPECITRLGQDSAFFMIAGWLMGLGAALLRVPV